MKDTCDRVARITQELKTLSTQFEWSAFQNSSPEDQAQILNGLLNGSLVEDLRTTVDDLSEFLWSYIESAAAESGQDADYVECEMQNVRLLRITEMLRLLHRSSCPSQNPLAFVERVTKSVDRYLEAVDEDLLCESRAGNTGNAAPPKRARHETTIVHGLRARAS